jgi:ABC-2 type transport system ATP-binding protein
MEPILTLSNISKSYGKTLAVDNVSFDLKKGELFGFLGPNGAGKTTTIKMISGLLRPDSGTITVGGIDVVKNPREAKQKMGYIPDNPYIYDRLTGREFLELVGSLYKMDKEKIVKRIEWLFELFSVEGWGDYYAAEYSHGMRQKIIMASALLHEPEIVVIDEPMVGLDPQSQHLVKGVFKKLVERGITVLMSTHTIHIAEELCSKIGIIFKGKLLKIGSFEELKADAENQNLTLEQYFVHITGSEKEIKMWDE